MVRSAPLEVGGAFASVNKSLSESKLRFKWFLKYKVCALISSSVGAMLQFWEKIYVMRGVLEMGHLDVLQH